MIPVKSKGYYFKGSDRTYFLVNAVKVIVATLISPIHLPTHQGSLLLTVQPRMNWEQMSEGILKMFLIRNKL